VVSDFDGKVLFVEENYGDSKLAKRLGVTRYPAIFVDDVLVATPSDFGFYGKGEAEGGGRYTPFKSAAGHDRFRADLTRMIDLILEGRKESARAQAAPASQSAIRELPALAISDLDGRALTRADLAGRPVLVEFWATWCPPCRSTLGWLGDLKRRHGDRLAVVAIAVQSEEPEVRKIAADLKLPITWTLGTPELGRAFGDVSAVPTLFLFGADGRTAAAYYGAPPTLHAEAEAALAALLR
jgi:thiol-disulfide isomerase/thioredoxin